MIIIQHKVNSYGDKVINIPSKLYRGISVSLEELQLMELEGIDMYPP